MAITNTLIKLIQNTKFAGEAYQNSNKLKNQKDDIANFSTLIDDVYSKFNNSYRNYCNLKSIVNISIDFAAVSFDLRQLKAKFALDEYDRSSISALKKDLNKIENDLKRTWEGYISERISAIEGVLLSLDKLISDMPEKQILLSNKLQFSNASPGNSTAIRAIEVYVNTANALLTKLNLKDSVVEFIKLLASGRTVTLSDLNEEVYEWIKASGFAGKINIAFQLQTIDNRRLSI